MIGTTIGNYRITERIGGGGIGEVWKAIDLGLDRVVAIKALRPELAVQEQLVARFRSEARTLARLSHANIATLHALLENRESLFMVMEYVEGRTLSSLIRAAGRFDLGTAFDILQQALDGIGHAHEVGVIHRDIKGSNLMVDGRGVVKIMDFGIARVMGSDRMTRHGKLVGTPEFMSPEQVRGQEATIQSDIYSLGVLFYEMLTGSVPFRMKGDFDLMQAQVRMTPPPPRSLAPEIPEAVEEVMLRALEKKPESRYRDTHSFRAAIERAGAPARATSTIGPLLAALGDGKSGEPENPTQQTDASDPSSAGTTQLILERDTGEDPERKGSATRPSHRWTRLAAGAALVGLALGANVLSTHPRFAPAASGGATPAHPSAAQAPSGATPVTENLIQANPAPAEQATEREHPAKADLDPLPGAEPPSQAAEAPAARSGAKADPGAAVARQPSATRATAPPRPRAALVVEPRAVPKKQRRSSEEHPGWVIRRE